MLGSNVLKSGLVVLTNSDGVSAAALIHAIKSRYFELTFDSKPKAEQKIAFGLEERKKDIQRAKKELTFDPVLLASVSESRRLSRVNRLPPE